MTLKCDPRSKENTFVSNFGVMFVVKSRGYCKNGLSIDNTIDLSANVLTYNFPLVVTLICHVILTKEDAINGSNICKYF